MLPVVPRKISFMVTNTKGAAKVLKYPGGIKAERRVSTNLCVRHAKPITMILILALECQRVYPFL
jgi:hypothetical protein